VNRTDVTWAIGRLTIGTAVRLLAPLRVYGLERVPRAGGLVLAVNHFSWLDPPALGTPFPRPIAYVAKSEAHRVPGVGQLIRAFGTLSIRRGESDREAVRQMREVVRRGEVLGLFVEGTRQRSEPGKAQPGAAMIAIQERVPVLCGAIYGTQHWRLGSFTPVSVALSLPLRLDDQPRNARGYRAASQVIEREIRRQWDWLAELHALDRRPAYAVPPA
jgi:1-acyl-sn-glycerol-3-phosphate acyltransferase